MEFFLLLIVVYLAKLVANADHARSEAWKREHPVRTPRIPEKWERPESLPYLPWEPLTQAGHAYRARQIRYRQEHGLPLDA